MAEGPSIVILKEKPGVFVGDRNLRIEGNAPIAKERLPGQRILGLRRFGKHFLVEMPEFSLRVHLLVLGCYCINEHKDKPVKLGLGFANAAEINFYSCSVKFIGKPLRDLYDWGGNVIRNEVLFRIRVHPLSTVGALPPARLRDLVKHARLFTFEFDEWKKADMDGDESVRQGDTLAKHWLVHNKKSARAATFH